MPRTPTEFRPAKTRTSGTGKRMHCPRAVVSITSSASVQVSTRKDALALAELHGDDAGAAHVDEIGELVPPHRAAGRGEHHVELLPARLVLRQRHDRGDPLALFERQEVDQRLAARLRRGERQPPDLLLVDLAARGEEQHRRVRVRHEELGDEILLARRHAGAALAAALLRPVLGQRHALDVAGMADGDDHVLALDQVLVLEVGPALDDLGLARRRELVADRLQLVLDDRLDARARGQDVEVVADLRGELLQLLGDLVAAERGQPLQAQLEDGARLLVGEPVGAVLAIAWRGSAMSWISGSTSFAGQRRSISRSRAICGSFAERMSAITSSILATAIARPTNTCARSRALPSRNFVRRPTTSSRKAMKLGQDVLQPQQLRAAAVQRHHVHAEARLQRREAVELVQHHVGDRVALQLDDDADAVAVGLVADVGDALDPLVAHELGHLLLHRRLVHLIGDLGDDDRLALLADRPRNARGRA